MTQQFHFWLYISERNKSTNSESYMYPSVQGSIIYNNQDMDLDIDLDSILKSRDITSPTICQHIKKQRYYFANKGPSNPGYGFSSSHVWMWDLDHKEGCALKNWWFWTVVLRTLESPLDCKEIQPVNLKGNQSWIFIGGTDTEAEVPILWPPDAKNWLIGKDPDAGKGWRQEKGTTEDEMVGWHHWLNGHEFEWTPGVGDIQVSLGCCNHGVAKSRTQLSN